MNKQQLKSLLDSLSFSEKAGQLFQGNKSMFGGDGAVTGLVEQGKFSRDTIQNIGSVFNIFGKKYLKQIQKQHLKHNKVPLIFMADIIHGFDTVFPISLGLACSFNPELVRETAAITAKEAAADGLNATFSPMVDLSRDARWGRCAESYGEDVLLGEAYAKAMVKGYQGGDLTDYDTIAACVKHFAAYGAPIDGKDYNSVELSERALRQYYLKSYKSAIDAGAAMVMTSFNTVGGIPATLDPHLMNDILRGEWGFDGTVVSDYAAIEQCMGHGSGNSEQQVAELAMKATVDIDMMDNFYSNHLKTLVESGRLTMKNIDNAVMRVLELKNKLGLLDDPYRYLNDDRQLGENERKLHLQTARQAVYESSVLLKNDENILPIKPNQKVAFIGPFIDETELYSKWSDFMPNMIVGKSIADSIKIKYGDERFTFEPGCPKLCTEEFADASFDDICYGSEEQHLAAAVENARRADLVVMALGEHRAQFGESRSRTKIVIPPVQMNLFNEVYKVNKNIAVVLFCGRPLDIGEISQKARAVLTVWFPGSAGGEAIADMLFGTAAPSGRLAMSFPRTSAQCPIFYSHLPTGHGHGFPDGVSSPYTTRYIDCSKRPLYPFGHGKTYTDFEYSNMRLSDIAMRADSAVTVSVDVKNIGPRDGYETVQMYLRDRFATLVSRPVKELKAFEKVFIKSGESKTVSFEINEKMLRFYNYKMNNESEPGEFYVFVGASSEKCEMLRFEFVK